MSNDRNTLRVKRKTAIAGMTVCMAALVVTGYNRGRSMRKIHSWAGLALIGLSVWHWRLYQPKKTQRPVQRQQRRIVSSVGE